MIFAGGVFDVEVVIVRVAADTTEGRGTNAHSRAHPTGFMIHSTGLSTPHPVGKHSRFLVSGFVMVPGRGPLGAVLGAPSGAPVLGSAHGLPWLMA